MQAAPTIANSRLISRASPVAANCRELLRNSPVRVKVKWDGKHSLCVSVALTPQCLKEPTASISISIAGFGSATTTQVVRAGYGAGPNADA